MYFLKEKTPSGKFVSLPSLHTSSVSKPAGTQTARSTQLVQSESKWGKKENGSSFLNNNTNIVNKHTFEQCRIHALCAVFLKNHSWEALSSIDKTAPSCSLGSIGKKKKKEKKPSKLQNRPELKNPLKSEI